MEPLAVVRRQCVDADELDHVRDALAIAEAAEGLFVGREFSVDSGTVLRLAASSRCTAYDCEFVALAQHLAVRLVTLDRALVAAFPSIAVPIDAISNRAT